MTDGYPSARQRSTGHQLETARAKLIAAIVNTTDIDAIEAATVALAAYSEDRSRKNLSTEG